MLEMNESVVLGPYSALLITIIFNSLLLKDNKSLMAKMQEVFDTTIDMFSKELKACQESRDAMIARISEIERRVGKQ